VSVCVCLCFPSKRKNTLKERDAHTCRHIVQMGVRARVLALFLTLSLSSTQHTPRGSPSKHRQIVVQYGEVPRSIFQLLSPTISIYNHTLGEGGKGWGGVGLSNGSQEIVNENDLLVEDLPLQEFEPQSRSTSTRAPCRVESLGRP